MGTGLEVFCSGESQILPLVMVRDAVPMNKCRQRCILSMTAVYPRCQGSEKNIDHLVRTCPGPVNVWRRFMQCLPHVSGATTTRQWMSANLQVAHNALFCAVVWNLWK